MAASAQDAFDLVIPSMPGYGFSGKPTTTGWGTVRIARAWTELMKRLGYTAMSRRAAIGVTRSSSSMALLAPPELLGIHTNYACRRAGQRFRRRSRAGEPAPTGLSAEEERATTSQLRLR